MFIRLSLFPQLLTDALGSDRLLRSHFPPVQHRCECPRHTFVFITAKPPKYLLESRDARKPCEHCDVQYQVRNALGTSLARKLRKRVNALTNTKHAIHSHNPEKIGIMAAVTLMKEATRPRVCISTSGKPCFSCGIFTASITNTTAPTTRVSSKSRRNARSRGRLCRDARYGTCGLCKVRRMGV